MSTPTPRKKRLSLLRDIDARNRDRRVMLAAVRSFVGSFIILGLVACGGDPPERAPRDDERSQGDETPQPPATEPDAGAPAADPAEAAAVSAEVLERKSARHTELPAMERRPGATSTAWPSIAVR